MLRLIRDILRIDQLRRREVRLLDACGLARAQNADMQRPGARVSSPTDQHWCDLYDILQPEEQD